MADSASKEKADRRVLRTKRSIKVAFEKLLESTSPDKISISAIAREADIDRKTFYLHYASVEDLLRSIAEEFVDALFHNLIEKSSQSGVGRTPGFIIVELDSTLRDLRYPHEHIVSTLSVDFLTDCLEDPARKAYLESSLAHNVETSDSDASEFLIRFYLAGTLSAYLAWIKAGQPMPIESVAAAIDKTLVPNGDPSLGKRPPLSKKESALGPKPR